MLPTMRVIRKVGDGRDGWCGAALNATQAQKSISPSRPSMRYLAIRFKSLLTPKSVN
jgi:hypothetical protein